MDYDEDDNRFGDGEPIESVEGVPDELVAFANRVMAASKGNALRVEADGSGITAIQTHPVEYDRRLSRDWEDFIEAGPDGWQDLVDQLVRDVPTIEPMSGALPYCHTWRG